MLDKLELESVLSLLYRAADAHDDVLDEDGPSAVMALDVLRGDYARSRRRNDQLLNLIEGALQVYDNESVSS